MLRGVVFSFLPVLCCIRPGNSSWLTCTPMGTAFATYLQCQPICEWDCKACWCHANAAAPVPMSCLACMHACCCFQQDSGLDIVHMTHAPYVHMDMQPPHQCSHPPPPNLPPPPTCPAVMHSDIPRDCLLQYMVLYQWCLSDAQNINSATPAPPLQPTNLPLPSSHAF